MNTYTKIKRLWEYLRIRDDQSLIIRVYNPGKDSDEFLVVNKNDDLLQMSVSDRLTDEILSRPYHLVMQRDFDNKFEIPSVNQIEHDQLIDY